MKPGKRLYYLEMGMDYIREPYQIPKGESWHAAGTEGRHNGKFVGGIDKEAPIDDG